MKVLTGIIAGMLILLILIGVAAAAILTKGFTEADPYDVQSKIDKIINNINTPKDDGEKVSYALSPGDKVSLSYDNSKDGARLYIGQNIEDYKELADYIKTEANGSEVMLYPILATSGKVVTISAYIDNFTLRIIFRLYENGAATDKDTIRIAEWNMLDGADWNTKIYADQLAVDNGRIRMSYTAFYPSSEDDFTIADVEYEGLGSITFRVPAKIANKIINVINSEV